MDDTTTVDFEDRLVPVATLGGDLYLFSTSDGAIYQLGESLAIHRQLLPSRTFAVPGDDCLYSVSESNGSASVQTRSLSGVALARAACSLNDGEFALSVISGERDRYVVVRHEGGAAAFLVSLGTGRRASFTLPDGARPLFVTHAGDVVYQAGATWATSDSGGTPEVGIVTSWAAGRFIVATDVKAERRYTLIDGSSRRVLDAPDGWEIRQAIVHRDGITMICLNGSHGYATWDGQSLGKLSGTVIAYPLGDRPPVIRGTGFASGSMWRHGSSTWQGIVRARSDLCVRITSVDGCPSVHITSTTRRSDCLLIALHGGPDSVEWDDLRYGGIYRDLVAGGTDVLIVNYAGSQGFGFAHQRRAWQAWVPTLTSLGARLQEFSDGQGYARLKMLGVSFGAWAALIASTNAAAERIVVASPVLRMVAHLQRHRDEHEWASVRFGADYAAAQRGDDLLAGVRAPVFAVVAMSDRTVSVADTQNACEVHGWDIVRVPGGHYPASVKDATIRWNAIRSAIQALWA